jgi:hypothetical protein
MKKILVLVSLAMLFTGCASVNKVPMTAQTASSLKQQTLTHTTRARPDFAAITAAKASFAMVGAFAMISDGNNIVKTNDVADPANTIAAGLAKALAESHGVKVSAPAAVTSNDAAEIAAAVKDKASYVLDVQTVNWSFAYFPTDWTHYRVMYAARARLIDTATKNIVAEGACSRVPDTNVNAPTYDQLTANSAALLKQELALAAGACVTSLKAEMLSI